VVVLSLALFAAPPSTAASKADVTRQIQFGTEMAKDGNWNEAIFRWKRALTLDPQNPRIHNNLAVAYESLGDYAKANAEYVAALACPEPPAEVRINYEQFKNFYGRYKEIVSSPDSHTLEGPKTPGGDAH
jgi:Flp pilus assembly protein TadD